MDTESIAEFLGEVPLLQRLPSSSVKKIAELVKVKHYDRGEFVILKGQSEGGVYFIWEGEAEVCRNADEDNEIHPEFLLKRYDYFGHGAPTTDQQVDVIASSKLTCLMLPDEHCYLLRPKSIWNADEGHETSSSVEKILHLDPIEVNLFQGITLPDAPKFGKVFGGQFVGQALAAACKTVDCLKTVHHLQAYFLLVGDTEMIRMAHDTYINTAPQAVDMACSLGPAAGTGHKAGDLLKFLELCTYRLLHFDLSLTGADVLQNLVPIIYQVHRARDGKSFATRRVDAIQKGNVVFTLLASFQKEEKGFDHQEASMPSVPTPDMLLSLEELRERRIIDPRLPRSYRNKVAMSKLDPWPIDIRFCEPNTSTNQTRSPPSLRYWFRAKGKLSDDQALHRCVVAYASDLLFVEVSSNPHRKRGLKISVLSLNHTMWFHRAVKADDWLLFVIESPSASAGRGLCLGQMFNMKGELVVSLAQEGLIREARRPQSAIRAKY